MEPTDVRCWEWPIEMCAAEVATVLLGFYALFCEMTGQSLGSGAWMRG